jgi:peptidoglycan/xylan/chitin deacetylase (PgdA/CDA1 family)
VLASAGRGSVVLSHDTLPGTEEAYRTIVPELTAAGYRLVTVDQLLGPSQPGQLRGGY